MRAFVIAIFLVFSSSLMAQASDWKDVLHLPPKDPGSPRLVGKAADVMGALAHCQQEVRCQILVKEDKPGGTEYGNMWHEECYELLNSAAIMKPGPETWFVSEKDEMVVAIDDPGSGGHEGAVIKCRVDPKPATMPSMPSSPPPTVAKAVELQGESDFKFALTVDFGVGFSRLDPSPDHYFDGTVGIGGLLLINDFWEVALRIDFGGTFREGQTWYFVPQLSGGVRPADWIYFGVFGRLGGATQGSYWGNLGFGVRVYPLKIFGSEFPLAVFFETDALGRQVTPETETHNPGDQGRMGLRGGLRYEAFF